MVKKEFGTLDINKAKAVVNYFSSKASRGRARDIGVSGSFMSSLCARGYAKVAGVAEEYICIDKDSNLHKKVEVNIYELTISAAQLAAAYNNSRGRMADVEKTKAETLISCAQDRLNEAKRLLEKI